jgi:transposase
LRTDQRPLHELVAAQAIATPNALAVLGGRCQLTYAELNHAANRLSIFYLPPYSPELNPDEWAWKNIKHDQIKKAVPISQQHSVVSS